LLSSSRTWRWPTRGRRSSCVSSRSASVDKSWSLGPFARSAVHCTRRTCPRGTKYFQNFSCFFFFFQKFNLHPEDYLLSSSFKSIRI
jgi:hypothetical protein